MVAYLLFKQGKIVKVAKNLKEVSQIVGKSERTLIRRFGSLIGHIRTIDEGGFLIQKKEANIKKIKEFKKPVDTEGIIGGEEDEQQRYRVMGRRFKGKEEIAKTGYQTLIAVNPAEGEPESRRVRVQKPYIMGQDSDAEEEINPDEQIYSLIANIQQMRPDDETTKRSYFSIYYTLEDADEPDGIFNGSTKFLKWDEFLTNIDKQFKEWVDNYGETKILSVELRWIDTGLIQNQIVYGSMQDLMEEFYKKRTANAKDKAQFFRFLKTHKIGNRKTKTNCFLYSVVHSMLQTDDEKKADRKLKNLLDIHEWGDEPRELDYMAKILSEFYNIQIWIYDDDLKVSAKYGEEYPQIAKVMIYACHSFYILDKQGDQDFRKIAKKLNKQNPMKPKKTDDDENDEYVIYGAYDAETYNEMLITGEGLQKGKTKAFCYGYVHDAGEYKSVFPENNTEDITLKFINSLKANLKIKKVDGKAIDTRYILYAHNGGKFDAYMVFYTLLKNNFYIKSFLPKDGRLLQLVFYGKSYENDDGTKANIIIDLRDSYSILSGSLDSLLNDFKCNVKKLSGTVDYKSVNPENYHTQEIKDKFYEYLQNDVLGLHELMGKVKDVIKETYNIDLKKTLTNASIAREFFFQNHDFVKYPLNTLPLDTYRELKPFYYGGRNEAFKIGCVPNNKGKFHYYDFTSLYPYVMKKYPIPYGEFEHHKAILNGLTEAEALESYKSRNWIGMIKIKVKSNSQDFKPYFGIKEDGKLIFRHFEDWTEIITTTPHLNNAIERGLNYSYKFMELWEYKNGDKFFEPLIDQCYKLKSQAEQEGNKPKRQMAKIIINSLYGFFGIKWDKMEQVEIKKFKKQERRKHYIDKHLNRGRLINFEDVGQSTVFYTEEELKVRGANIAIAMFITDYARMELYNLMCDVEELGGNILYCDTDSIICDIKLEDTPLNDKYGIKAKNDGVEIKIGNLTNESDIRGGGYSDLIILGCKAYYLEYHPETWATYEPWERANIEKSYKKALIEAEKKDTKKERKEAIENAKEDYEKSIKKLKIESKNEMKFKGINIKQKYHNKEYNHDDKLIILKGIDKEKGTEKITPNDYKLISEGYTVKADNFSFLSSVKTLHKTDTLIYIENVKMVKKQYLKAEELEDGTLKPFYR